jgi:hypothetical protein
MVKEHMHHLRKSDFFILGFILVIAFVFRLYKINSPVADFHSWRQADTAAVARNFTRTGFDLLHPRYDDLSNIQTGKENPQGYRMVEFPVYNALNAAMFMIAPIISLEVWGRVISIISSLIAIAIVYYFLYKEHSRPAAIVGSVVFATYPFFVFFSRVILPDMNAVGFAMLSIFFLHIFTDSPKAKPNYVWFSLSLVSLAVSLLIKPTIIFYTIPLLYLFLDKYRMQVYKYIPFYIFFILGFIPLVLWRKYILNYPEGIPGSSWLITSVNTPQGLQNIFLRPAFFRWIFFERINNLILGGYTAFLFLIGLIVKSKRYFLHSILLSMFAYLFVFEGGNVQHAYYQILIFPGLAIAVGLGAGYLIEHRATFISKAGVYILIALTLGYSLVISYNLTKGYYGIPQDLVDIAAFIKNATNQNDKIITDTLGDTTLLYLSDRKGAPAVYEGLTQLKAKGYKYFVTLSKDVATQIKKEQPSFKVIGENDKFTMFKL